MVSPKRKLQKDCLADASGKRRKEEENCPVAVQRIDYDALHNFPCASLSLSPTLSDLMYMPKDEFLQTYFRRKAVHVCSSEKGSSQQRHESCRVEGLKKELFSLDAEKILRETSSDSIFLWLKGQRSNKSSTSSGNDDKSRSLIRSIEVEDVDTAIALHKTAGHATYCRAPPEVEQPLVASLLRHTGLGCGQYDPWGDSMISMGRGEVETFISTDGHLTNWHFDFQENFTIQLSGIKRWTLQHGTLRDPIRGCTPHYAAPEAVELQLKAAHLFDRKFQFGFPKTDVTAKGDVTSIDVKPGDVLYFPAGMWHKVETIEPGVSINVSLMASNYAEVTCRALHQYLFNDERWRAPVINNSTSNALVNLKQLLSDLPTIISELEKNDGGAESILPPILRYPPKFEPLAGDKSDEWQDVDDEHRGGDDGSENDEVVEETDGNVSERTHASDDDRLASTSVDNSPVVTNDEAIDPRDFHGYPIDWDIPIEDTLVLRRNPLAALHKLSEITSFYNEDDGTTYELQKFLLNVNYSGNETLESAVRVAFFDSKSGVGEKLYQWERDATDKTTKIHVDEENHYHISFLVFHGYLQIVKE